MSTEKLVIYTGLFNDYDNLIIPIIKHKNIKYICFTNNIKLKSKEWEIIFINEKGSGNFLNRKVKMLPHIYLKNYKKSIYIDANVLLVCDPNKLYSYLLKYDFIVFEHPNKSTFLDELNVNFYNKNINDEIYQKLLRIHSNYIFFNLSSTKSIPTNRILVRNHLNKELIDLMENWWYDYSSLNINRDQLILPYLINRYSFQVKIIKSKYNYINYYILRGHKNYSSYLKFKFFFRFSIIEFLIRIVFKFKKFSLYLF